MACPTSEIEVAQIELATLSDLKFSVPSWFIGLYLFILFAVRFQNSQPLLKAHPAMPAGRHLGSTVVCSSSPAFLHVAISEPGPGNWRDSIGCYQGQLIGKSTKLCMYHNAKV